MNEHSPTPISEFTIDQGTNTGLELWYLTPIADGEEPTVVWPPSERNPQGRAFRHDVLTMRKGKTEERSVKLTVQLTVKQATMLDLPDADSQAVLTARISGHSNPDRLMTVGRFKDGLCERDSVEPVRPDGRTLYSIQQHRFGVSIDRFFFVLYLAADRAARRVSFQIDKVHLVRRKDTPNLLRIKVEELFQRGNTPLAEISGILAKYQKDDFVLLMNEALNVLWRGEPKQKRTKTADAENRTDAKPFNNLGDMLTRAIGTV